MGIQNFGGMRSHLGLPENLGGSKIQVFSFVQDLLNNRVNGWTFKFFTKGGKKLIIKSVVTALPNHVMSCYRLPKATAKKTDDHSSTILVESRGKHMRHALEIMGQNICKLGWRRLGFKDITDFNTAMLGKQLWCLIEKPNTLFS